MRLEYRIFINKEEKEVKIIDAAIPYDMRVKNKELEKIEKYQLLNGEIRKLYNMKKVGVIPIVTGALEVASKGFETKMYRFLSPGAR